MSWYDAVLASGIQAAPSPWDAARFGVSVDRVTVSAAASVTLGEVQEAVGASTADVVVLRYPARHVSWFAQLAPAGRTPLLADSLGYWRLTPRAERPLPACEETTVEIDAGLDRDELDHLMALFFADYGNHYLANPLFDPDAVIAGYQEWAGRAAAEAGLIVLRRGSGVVGVGVVEDQPDYTEFILAGVIPEERGRGQYARLMAAVERRAWARGVSSVVTSTQGHNTHGQRAWVRFGFEPVHTLYTLHLVRTSLLARTEGHRPMVRSSRRPVPVASSRRT
jgi:GNAT superfamily N-acetyltransferase